MYNMQLINPCAGPVKTHLDISTELAIYCSKKGVSSLIVTS